MFLLSFCAPAWCTSVAVCPSPPGFINHWQWSYGFVYEPVDQRYPLGQHQPSSSIAGSQSFGYTGGLRGQLRQLPHQLVCFVDLN